ncbi:UDP-N-acetyl-D-glucosamine dehydrogenase [Candidatus Atribacteria bacterium HGW-Atribacteria-1]|nr:MAG: UDP-N-acetyl-D-glucosamine dehydrogenase [Candidatus Atribacteria bacterium HGW-Atribacteria-1]
MKKNKNPYKQQLISKIKNKTAILGVIGLGYVGLPLAVEKARAGYKTIGFDIQKKKVRWVNEGHNYIEDIEDSDLKGVVDKGLLRATADYSFIKDVDTICICVPTPLDIYQQPDLSYVKNSTENIARYLHFGMLIILESTTYPGTTEELMKPILEKESNLKCGKDFFLAFSPERIDPGNPWYKVNNTPKVVGGVTPDCTEVASYLYSNIIQGKIHPVSSPKVAEMEKIYENVFRYTNIALANEMSILCHKMNIDFWEVIEAAKTKPYGFMPFYPGPGIGGHCIPLDPFYLTWKAREYNYHTRLIELAGEINKYMPEYVVERTAKILSQKFKKSLNGAKVLLLGVAYKKDISDLRESPALEIIKRLEQEGAIVSYYDPYISEFTTNGKEYKSLKELTKEEIKEKNVIIITTDHSTVNYEMIAKNANAVFDTRNVIKLNSEKIEKL